MQIKCNVLFLQSLVVFGCNGGAICVKKEIVLAIVFTVGVVSPIYTFALYRKYDMEFVSIFTVSFALGI